MKLFAARDRTSATRTALPCATKKTLDWRYIEEQLTPLAEAKEEPVILRLLARIRILGASL